MIQDKAYPVFHENQVLTEDHLNNVVRYLELEDRESRIVAGSGIRCGLNVGYQTENVPIPTGSFTRPIKSITLSIGAGTTSKGFLIVNPEKRTFNYYQEFILPENSSSENYLTDGAGKPFTLYELLESNTDPDDSTKINNNALRIKDFSNLKSSMAVILHLEIASADLAKCKIDSCDNEGYEKQLHWRALLINKNNLDKLLRKYLNTENNEGNEDNIKTYFRKKYDVHEVRIRRPEFKCENTQSYADIHKEYLNLCQTAVEDFETAFGKSEAAYRRHINGLDFDIETLKNHLVYYNTRAKDPKGIQYFYDHLKDVAMALNEFNDAAFAYHCDCSLNEERYPNYLMAGSFEEPAARDFKDDVYRHYFEPCCKDLAGTNQKKELVNLYERVNVIIENYRDNFIEESGDLTQEERLFITAESRLSGHLGDLALPYYYKKDSTNLRKRWNPNKFARGHSQDIPFYWDRSTTNTDAASWIQDPNSTLRFRLDKHDCFHIEGHLGMTVTVTEFENAFDDLKREFGLPIDLKVLEAKTSPCEYKHPYANLKELETLHDLEKKEIYCFLKNLFDYFRRFQLITGSTVKAGPKRSTRLSGNYLTEMMALGANATVSTGELASTVTGDLASTVAGGLVSTVTGGLVSSGTVDALRRSQALNQIIVYRGLPDAQKGNFEWDTIKATRDGKEYEFINDYHNIIAEGFIEDGNLSGSLNVLAGSILKVKRQIKDCSIENHLNLGPDIHFLKKLSRDIVAFIDQYKVERPRTAYNPDPADGAVDVTQSPILTWSPGDNAVSHQVYFGTDTEAVNNAVMSSPEFRGAIGLGSESYNAGNLELNTTYYWRIDEVEADGTIYKGDVWSFTTKGTGGPKARPAVAGTTLAGATLAGTTLTGATLAGTNLAGTTLAGHLEAEHLEATGPTFAETTEAGHLEAGHLEAAGPTSAETTEAEHLETAAPTSAETSAAGHLEAGHLEAGHLEAGSLEAGALEAAGSTTQTPGTVPPVVETPIDKCVILPLLTSLYSQCWANQLLWIKKKYDEIEESPAQGITFPQYVHKHPGIEHIGGVPKGGTFIVVYETSGEISSPGDEIVADFCLPYICCSDTSSVEYIVFAELKMDLPEKVCNHDEEHKINYSPNGAILTSDTIELSEENGSYSFNSGGLALGEHNITISLGNKSVTSSIQVIKHPEAEISEPVGPTWQEELDVYVWTFGAKKQEDGWTYKWYKRNLLPEAGEFIHVRNGPTYVHKSGKYEPVKFELRLDVSNSICTEPSTIRMFEFTPEFGWDIEPKTFCNDTTHAITKVEPVVATLECIIGSENCISGNPEDGYVFDPTKLNQDKYTVQMSLTGYQPHPINIYVLEQPSSNFNENPHGPVLVGNTYTLTIEAEAKGGDYEYQWFLDRQKLSDVTGNTYNHEWNKNEGTDVEVSLVVTNTWMGGQCTGEMEEKQILYDEVVEPELSIDFPMYICNNSGKEKITYSPVGEGEELFGKGGTTYVTHNVEENEASFNTDGLPPRIYPIFIRLGDKSYRHDVEVLETPSVPEYNYDPGHGSIYFLVSNPLNPEEYEYMWEIREETEETWKPAGSGTNIRINGYSNRERRFFIRLSVSNKRCEELTGNTCKNESEITPEPFIIEPTGDGGGPFVVDRERFNSLRGDLVELESEVAHGTFVEHDVFKASVASINRNNGTLFNRVLAEPVPGVNPVDGAAVTSMIGENMESLLAMIVNFAALSIAEKKFAMKYIKSNLLTVSELLIARSKDLNTNTKVFEQMTAILPKARSLFRVSDATTPKRELVNRAAGKENMEDFLSLVEKI